MVNHNILAAIVSSLLIAGTVNVNAAEIYNKSGNKLDIYGKSSGIYHFSGRSGNSGSDKTYARIGFRGETQINDQLIGYGQWEYNLTENRTGGNPNLQSDNKVNLAYAGLKTSEHGSFDYGRNYGVIYDALSYTNVLPGFGGDTAYSDNFFAGRNSGVATYRNTNFFGLVDGLNFGLQYLSKNNRADSYIFNLNEQPDNFSDVRRSNGRGWGSSLSYEFDKFSIIGAYGIANRTRAQKDLRLYGDGNKAEQWVTGIKYNANNVYLATNYGKTRSATPINNGFANRTQDTQLVAQYQFDFGLRPSIAYIQSKAKDIKNVGDTRDLVKYVEIGATYFFNKNMSTYIDYKINQIDKNNSLGVNSDDAVALGITYQF